MEEIEGKWAKAGGGKAKVAMRTDGRVAEDLKKAEDSASRQHVAPIYALFVEGRLDCGLLKKFVGENEKECKGWDQINGWMRL